MINQRTRYCTTIFPLDRLNFEFNIASWDKDDYQSIVDDAYKHYGLFLISTQKEIYIHIEYTNIIWDYKIFFGSCKKRYNELAPNDERWQAIEKGIESDLKRMGLEELKNDVIDHLKNHKYYEYNKKKDIQFKKYCITEEE